MSVPPIDTLLALLRPQRARDPDERTTFKSAIEGLIVRIKADCPYRACKFRIRPASLTAVAGDDFVLTARSRALD